MEIDVFDPGTGDALGAINDHLADPTDAHDASAISVADSAAQFVGDDVEEVLAEIQDNLDAHLADATDAHDASAISVVPFGAISADDVQSALEEIAAESGASVSMLDLTDVTGAPPASGEAPVWDGDSFELTNVATQAELDAHVNDGADAHDASAISVVPFSSIAATDVQAALEEIVAEAAGGGTTLTVQEEDVSVDVTVAVLDFEGDDFDVSESPEDEANIAISANIARQAALDAHINDGTDAHDASAISVLDTAAQYAATDVEAALAEVMDALQAHEADATDAHDASAISFSAVGGLAADDVQEALAELDSEKATPAQVATEIADQKRCVEVQVSDPNGDAITTGDGKAYFFIPALLNGHNLVAAHAAVTTVSSSGTPTIQIHNVTQAADMLTTKITIDANEKTSYTAAAAPGIDAGNDDVATGDEIRIDIDVAGTGAKGLTVMLTFEAP